MNNIFRLVVLLLFLSCGYRLFGIITISDFTLILSASVFTVKLRMIIKERLVWFLLIFTIVMPMLSIGINSINEVEYLKSVFQLVLYVYCSGLVVTFYLKRLTITDVEMAFIYFGVASSFLVFLQYIMLLLYDVNIFFFISTWGGKDSWIENYIRIAGLTSHYNQLAIVLFPSFVMALERKCFLAALGVFFALLCSGSRIGLACALFSAYIYLLKHGKYKLFIMLSVVAIVVFSYLATTDLFLKRFSFIISGELDGSTLERFDLWSAAFKLYSTHWFFGVGPGQYREILNVDNVESGVIDIFLNYGLPGVVSFIILIVANVPLGFKDRLFGFKLSVLLVFIQNSVQPFLFMSIVGTFFWVLFMVVFLYDANIERYAPEGASAGHNFLP